MVGEHIRVRRSGRWHHAIDCGDETVLHLADEPGEAPVRVRRSYRPEFVSGAEVVEVVTHRERTFPPNEVVARAFSRIADPVLASMFRDSEAFAEWCATGRISAAATGAPPAEAPTPPSVRSAPSGGTTAAARGQVRKRAASRAARPAPRPRSGAGASRPGKKKGGRPLKSSKSKTKRGGVKAKKPRAGKTRRPARRKR